MGRLTLVWERGGELDVEVGGEPIRWLQMLQQLHRRWRTQRAVLDLRLQEGLLAEQRLRVAMACDVLRPVMAHEDVKRLLKLQQP